MKKLIVLGTVATAVLVACGGGGGGTGSTPLAGVTAANPFAAEAGTYVSNCSALNTIPLITGVSIATSEFSVLIVEAPIGSDKAKVTVQIQEFTGATCGPASAKTDDVTVRGDVSALPGTKTITGAVGEKSGTVKTAEVAFTGLTLSMGTLGFPIPTMGTKAKVGYLVEGNKIYGLSGSRAPDGLPSSFSKNFYAKQ